jgi:glutaredoxin
LAALVIGSTSAVSATDIHRWVDQNGKIQFGDRPPPGVASEQVVVKPNVYTSPEIQPLAAAVEPAPDVVLYSAQWCGYCRKARTYFQSQGIAFKEYDVEKSAQGRRDYRALNARGVPVILIGRQRMNGFSVEAFSAVYGQP